LTAALAKLGDVSAAEAIDIGDMRFHIEAAAKTELRTIAPLCGDTNEKSLRRAGAIAIYRDPADLLDHYDSLASHL
jgi:phosphoglycolate phosphatase-like HAD superfamily hydrolase